VLGGGEGGSEDGDGEEAWEDAEGGEEEGAALSALRAILHQLERCDGEGVEETAVEETAVVEVSPPPLLLVVKILGH
jgi:hypothetical protein